MKRSTGEKVILVGTVLTIGFTGCTFVKSSLSGSTEQVAIQIKEHKSSGETVTTVYLGTKKEPNLQGWPDQAHRPCLSSTQVDPLFLKPQKGKENEVSIKILPATKGDNFPQLPGPDKLVNTHPSLYFVLGCASPTQQQTAPRKQEIKVVNNPLKLVRILSPFLR